MEAFIGYGVCTLLLWLLQRNSSSSSDTSSSSKPSKYTDSNTDQISNPVPVVLGRGVIKQPLVSYYGDFRSEIYTEEYGMHSSVNWSSLIYPIIFASLAVLLTPNSVTVGTPAGPGVGTENTQGEKNSIILSMVFSVLMAILSMIFGSHQGRVTIQKGFKYYLGWQNIICWTGNNIGINRIWMNVYDTDTEESTYQGVWNSGDSAAYKRDNPNGVYVHIDREDLFGGPDEQGGFIGDIHIYLGTTSQPKDSWMISQMQQESVQESLRGLTPRYPMYVTSVIPTAYIGKQATIPDMWFEISNYPNTLGENNRARLENIYNTRITEYKNRLAELEQLDPEKLTYWQRVTVEDLTKRITDMESHGIWTLDKIGIDINPAEAIYEILTNSIWGCGGTDDDIDIASLVKLGITCEDESCGVSMVYSSITAAYTWIDNILNHINGVRYNDPTTGKLTFKLIRNDYDEDSLKVFDSSNSSAMTFTRVDWQETVASVSVKFTDASHYYDDGELSLTDLANIKITHNNKSSSIDGTYFTNATTAKWLAQLKLYSLAYPLSAINFETNRYAHDLTIGSPIKVTWSNYGIKNMIFRVTDVDYASLTSGKIAVTAVEDVFSFDKTEYMLSHGLSWVEPIYHPMSVDRYCTIELPYELTLSLDTYVYVLPVQPASHTVIWNLWTKSLGAYKTIGRYSTWSYGCRMVYTVEEDYDYSEDSYIEIYPIGNNSADTLDYKMLLINSNPTSYSNLSGQNLILVDDEIISYNTIIKMTNGNYRLVGIIRGVYDTLPKSHTTESIGYFLDYRFNVVSGGGSFCDEGVVDNYYYGFTTETTDEKQSFDVSVMKTAITSRRSESPSVMAYLQYGMYLGDLTKVRTSWDSAIDMSNKLIFTYLPRNKFKSQAIHKQADSLDDIVDSDICYRVSVLSNGVSFNLDYSATLQDEDGNYTNTVSFDFLWSDFCKNMGTKIKFYNDVSLEVFSYSNTTHLASHDSYIRQLSYVTPRVCGIITVDVDAQAYADLYTTSNGVVLPIGEISPALTFKFNQSPLLLVGVVTSESSNPKGWDGQYYKLSNVAYQILGFDDENGCAIIEKLELLDGFIVCSNFTQLVANTMVAFMYDGADWKDYILQE